MTVTAAEMCNRMYNKDSPGSAVSQPISSNIIPSRLNQASLRSNTICNSGHFFRILGDLVIKSMNSLREIATKTKVLHISLIILFAQVGSSCNEKRKAV